MNLHYGGAQIAVLAIFLVIALAFGALFVVVALRSRREVELEQVRNVGYRLRKPWLIGLGATLAAVLAALAFFIPASAAEGPEATEVRVVGGQFYWSLSPDTFRRGEHVVFDVTSADVNHGFGLYDPDGRLIGSVQAMPGYHNRLAVTLEHAGRYTIACFEYCGLDHHVMIRELEVVP
jgi:cytochrome c oxidase subunit 2